MHRLLTDLRRHPEVNTAFSFGETYHITVGERLTPCDLTACLNGKGHHNVSVFPVSATIEDCFMSLMKADTNE